jgi:hypothetical protein
MNGRVYPVGNCYPNSEYVLHPPDPCAINVITNDNKIFNKFNSIPQEYDVREGFNVCHEQRLIQPKLNLGGACKGEKAYNERNRWREWANLSPNKRGGYVRLVEERMEGTKVKNKKEKVFSVMGKIDIPNHFMPKH